MEAQGLYERMFGFHVITVLPLNSMFSAHTQVVFHVSYVDNSRSYHRALSHQPASTVLLSPLVSLLSYALIAGGNVLVLSSMWALGVTGTYLGDYFGILMSDRVTTFPFNVTDAPMYYGSTMSFLGTALLYGKPAGVLLTVEVLVAYLIALRYEE